MEIHVHYKVGSRSQELRNVGLVELQHGLDQLATNEKSKKVIDSRFGFKASDDKSVEDWIDALINTNSQHTLTLTEGILCNTSFMNNYWKSKTRAGTLLCLLQAHVQYEERQEQEKLDAELRNFQTPGGATSSVTATSVSVSEKEVEQWLKNWDEKHRK